jgi:hypothetical protein
MGPKSKAKEDYITLVTGSMTHLYSDAKPMLDL